MDITVYLADDDHDDRDFFSKSMEIVHSDIKLLLFEDGEDLMTHLKNSSAYVPDLIFLDINMPRKNGHECLCELRGNERYRNMPIIMFSTSTDERDVCKACENGASLYVKKPSTFLEHVDILKEVVGLHVNNQLLQLPKEHFVMSKNLKLH